MAYRALVKHHSIGVRQYCFVTFVPADLSGFHGDKAGTAIPAAKYKACLVMDAITTPRLLHISS